MKTFIITLYFIFNISNLTFAQWTEQSYGINALLNSVSAVNNNIVWACGDGAWLLSSTFLFFDIRIFFSFPLRLRRWKLKNYFNSKELIIPLSRT
jgi:hypothetical protein